MEPVAEEWFDGRLAYGGGMMVMNPSQLTLAYGPSAGGADLAAAMRPLPLQSPSAALAQHMGSPTAAQLKMLQPATSMTGAPPALLSPHHNKVPMGALQPWTSRQDGLNTIELPSLDRSSKFHARKMSEMPPQQPTLLTTESHFGSAKRSLGPRNLGGSTLVPTGSSRNLMNLSEIKRERAGSQYKGDLSRVKASEIDRSDLDRLQNGLMREMKKMQSSKRLLLAATAVEPVGNRSTHSEESLQRQVNTDVSKMAASASVSPLKSIIKNTLKLRDQRGSDDLASRNSPVLKHTHPSGDSATVKHEIDDAPPDSNVVSPPILSPTHDDLKPIKKQLRIQTDRASQSSGSVSRASAGSALNRNNSLMLLPPESSVVIADDDDVKEKDKAKSPHVKAIERRHQSFRNYYKNTRTLIDEAVNMLEGERAYNDAGLDKYLMGIKEIALGKRKRPKPRALPSINMSAVKGRKISKEVERFYK